MFSARNSQKAIWAKLQPAIDEYNRLKEELDKTHKEWDELSEESKVEEKKIELLTKGIEELKKKEALANKFYEEEDAYYAQQKLIKKIS